MACTCRHSFTYRTLGLPRVWRYQGNQPGKLGVSEKCQGKSLAYSQGNVRENPGVSGKYPGKSILPGKCQKVITVRELIGNSTAVRETWTQVLQKHTGTDVLYVISSNMSKMRHCFYNHKWEKNPAIASWIQQVPTDKRKAFCSVCQTNINLSNMGLGALKSHAQGVKHRNLVTRKNAGSKTQFSLTSMCENQSEAATPTASSLDPVPPIASPVNLMEPFENDDVLKAEILWTLKLIRDRQSLRSSDDASKILQAMFPDSNIAGQFACASNKAAYMTMFGIAEHFTSLLQDSVAGKFVIMLDERPNKEMQEKQLDIHIRFWDEQENKVSTRYLTSNFVRHAYDTDLQRHITGSLQSIGFPMQDLLQIGMDGPSVNPKFLRNVKEQLQRDHGATILDIGTCRLHTVHNALKAGEESSGWQVSIFLSNLYYLFKDSPARREDFSKLCKTLLMPLKFVENRWIENVSVSERALALWEDLLLYVSKIESKEVPSPQCRSYQVVKTCIKDPLFLPRLHFFKEVAGLLAPFLTIFRTDKPMVPYLGEELENMIRKLIGRFVKAKVLETANTLEKLAKLDVCDKSIQQDVCKVDLGFCTSKALCESSTNEKQRVEFRCDSRLFLEKLVAKLLEESPIAYSLVRHLACFNPVAMVKKSRKENKDAFAKVFGLLVSQNLVNEAECDELQEQYSDFLEDIPKQCSERFLAHTCNIAIKEGIDTLFHSTMEGKVPKLLQLVKMILILSHGQTTFERGFSINTELEVENMERKSLIARRLICDHVESVGGILSVDLSKGLLLSARMARKTYKRHLSIEGKEGGRCTKRKKGRRLAVNLTTFILKKTKD